MRYRTVLPVRRYQFISWNFVILLAYITSREFAMCQSKSNVTYFKATVSVSNMPHQKWDLYFIKCTRWSLVWHSSSSQLSAAKVVSPGPQQCVLSLFTYICALKLIFETLHAPAKSLHAGLRYPLRNPCDVSLCERLEMGDRCRPGIWTKTISTATCTCLWVPIQISLLIKHRRPPTIGSWDILSVRPRPLTEDILENWDGPASTFNHALIIV